MCRLALLPLADSTHLKEAARSSRTSIKATKNAAAAVGAIQLASAAGSTVHPLMVERFVSSCRHNVSQAAARLGAYKEWQHQLSTANPEPLCAGLRWGWHGHVRGLYGMPLLFVQVSENYY